MPLDVAAALHIVDDPARLRIHEEPVDRKVAPADILLGGRKGDPRRMASVVVTRLGPKGGDFIRPAVLDDDHDPEAGADGSRPREQGLHLFRPGRRDDVEILRDDTAHEVADTAAHPKGLVARPAQAADYGGGIIHRRARFPGLFPAASIA